MKHTREEILKALHVLSWDIKEEEIWMAFK